MLNGSISYYSYDHVPKMTSLSHSPRDRILWIMSKHSRMYHKTCFLEWNWLAEVDIKAIFELVFSWRTAP